MLQRSSSNCYVLVAVLLLLLLSRSRHFSATVLPPSSPSRYAYSSTTAGSAQLVAARVAK